jgi:hypothetical protein
MRQLTPYEYARVGWVLVALFAGRVIAQPLSLVMPGLPPFEAWHSATIPYWLLLLSQLVILATLAWTTYRIGAGHVTPRRSVGTAAIALGALYFAVMSARLVLGVTLLRDVRWFASPIPTMFHLVLASWLLLYGHLHRTLGPQMASTR